MLHSPDVSCLTSLRTRSFCPENPEGRNGAAARAEQGSASHASRELGLGWKVNPYVDIAPGETHVLVDIDEPGCVRHLWATTDRPHWRSLILRAYWDDSEEPAIEVPYGDFFCNGWGVYAPVSSAMVVAAPHGGMNSYWPMPFDENARITLENIGDTTACVYYQVDVETCGEYHGHGYLHAQYRRSSPLTAGETHVIAEDIDGRGQYVGTYLAWQPSSEGWWGEGEVKFWLDKDTDFPSIASTGLEDYMGGAWNFDVGGAHQTYSTPYLGLPQVLPPDQAYQPGQRFGMYRWHVPDPIRFARRLGRVDVQALGWQSEGRYKQLADDIASTCWFYLDEASTTRKPLPGRDGLAV